MSSGSSSMSSEEELVYGYIAVIGANLFFGSFGVPIKSKKITESKVNPLIFQSYKTIAVFLTSWLILTYNEYYFTWWGFVGASMWVPNGVLTVIIIRKIGLGAGQSIWSGLTVWVSFVWGATVLHEEVRSLPLSLMALLLLAGGIAGVAFVIDLSSSSSPPSSSSSSSPSSSSSSSPSSSSSSPSSVLPISSTSSSSKVVVNTSSYFSYLSSDDDHNNENNVYNNNNNHHHNIDNNNNNLTIKRGEEITENLPIDLINNNNNNNVNNINNNKDEDQMKEKKEKRKRYMIGIGLAIYVGFSNGSLLIPLSYAPPETQGITYVISFGIGAMCINAMMMGGYYMMYAVMGWRPYPQWQVKKAAVGGLSTGILWALGNFFSIYATLFLGSSSYSSLFFTFIIIIIIIIIIIYLLIPFFIIFIVFKSLL